MGRGKMREMSKILSQHIESVWLISFTPKQGFLRTKRTLAGKNPVLELWDLVLIVMDECRHCIAENTKQAGMSITRMIAISYPIPCVSSLGCISRVLIFSRLGL